MEYAEYVTTIQSRELGLHKSSAHFSQGICGLPHKDLLIVYEPVACAWAKH